MATNLDVQAMMAGHVAGVDIHAWHGKETVIQMQNASLVWCVDIIIALSSHKDFGPMETGIQLLIAVIEQEMVQNIYV